MPGVRSAPRMLSMHSSNAQITLELALDAEHIAGNVVAHNGARVPFAGWLDLASAIETAIDSTHRRSRR